MITKLLVPLLSLSLTVFTNILGMYEDNILDEDLKSAIRKIPKPDRESIIHANRAAYCGSLKDLETSLGDNTDWVFNQPAECEDSWLDGIMLPSKPKGVIATPLWFAVLSDRQPEQKINLLKEHFLSLEPLIKVENGNGEGCFKPLGNESRQDPFGTALRRHEGTNSALSRSVIIALIRKYPETMLARDQNGETILIRAARNLDVALLADLLYETNYNAQLFEDPIESRLNTPAELMATTPDAKRVVTPAKCLQTALEIARMATYTPPSNVIARFFKSEDFFEEQRQACISLLETAENKVQSRAQEYAENRNNEAPAKGLYQASKKEQ